MIQYKEETEIGQEKGMVKEVKNSTLNTSEILGVVARFFREMNERGLGKYFEEEFVRDGWGDLPPFLVSWIKLIPRLRESIRTSDLLLDKQRCGRYPPRRRERRCILAPAPGFCGRFYELPFRDGSLTSAGSTGFSLSG